MGIKTTNFKLLISKTTHFKLMFHVVWALRIQLNTILKFKLPKKISVLNKKISSDFENSSNLNKLN